jgi:phage gpG-like protein
MLRVTRDSLTPSLHRLSDPKLLEAGILAAGTSLIAVTQRAFDEPGLRPTAWANRKSGGSHPLLLLSGTLRQAWHLQGSGSLSVTLGNPTKYAAHHQFGSPKSSGRGSGVPARPSFPVTKDGQLTKAGNEAISEALEAVISDAY